MDYMAIIRGMRATLEATPSPPATATTIVDQPHDTLPHDGGEYVDFDDLLDLVFCPTCGSGETWVDVTDGQHCLKCDPPHRGLQWLERATALRRKHGLPVQPEVKLFAEELRRTLLKGKKDDCAN